MIKLVPALLLLASAALVAQPSRDGGSITGVVRDPNGQPVVGADAFIIGDTKRAVTDSTGRFEITKLDGGFYRIRVRRMGFFPSEVTTDLNKNGRVELKVDLRVRPRILASGGDAPQASGHKLPRGGVHCGSRPSKGICFTE